MYHIFDFVAHRSVCTALVSNCITFHISSWLMHCILWLFFSFLCHQRIFSFEKKWFQNYEKEWQFHFIKSRITHTHSSLRVEVFDWTQFLRWNDFFLNEILKAKWNKRPTEYNYNRKYISWKKRTKAMESNEFVTHDARWKRNSLLFFCMSYITLCVANGKWIANVSNTEKGEREWNDGDGRPIITTQKIECNHAERMFLFSFLLE